MTKPLTDEEKKARAAARLEAKNPYKLPPPEVMAANRKKAEESGKLESLQTSLLPEAVDNADLLLTSAKEGEHVLASVPNDIFKRLKMASIKQQQLEQALQAARGEIATLRERIKNHEGDSIGTSKGFAELRESHRILQEDYTKLNFLYERALGEEGEPAPDSIVGLKRRITELEAALRGDETLEVPAAFVATGRYSVNMSGVEISINAPDKAAADSLLATMIERHADYLDKHSFKPPMGQGIPGPPPHALRMPSSPMPPPAPYQPSVRFVEPVTK